MTVTERSAGFTLLEALLALVLTLMLMAGALALASTQVTLAATVPEALEIPQRARAAMQALVRDLAMAGAGPTAGPRTGPLVRFFAPILPRKPHVDPFNTVRTDAVALVAVPYTRAQASLAAPLPPDGPLAVVTLHANCPQGLLACGLEQDAQAVVFDDEGRFEMVAVTDVQPEGASLRWRTGEAGPGFQVGASIVEAAIHTYYFDAARRQLRHHDGDRTDTPVVDNVVFGAFEYFGESTPPFVPRPPEGVANCLYEADGVPRADLVTLLPRPSALVRLSPALFLDGPWCGAGGTRYDADLLRIRSVRVTLRLQAGSAAFRPSSGSTVPGASRRDATSLPDYEIRFQVSPRNLAVIR